MVAPFFCLQQVGFDELDPDVQALVPPAVRYGRIHPCMLVVPMGWSWAVWLVQRKHEHIVGGVAEDLGTSLVSDLFSSARHEWRHVVDEYVYRQPARPGG